MVSLHFFCFLVGFKVSEYAGATFYMPDRSRYLTVILQFIFDDIKRSAAIHTAPALIKNNTEYGRITVIERPDFMSFLML